MRVSQAWMPGRRLKSPEVSEPIDIDVTMAARWKEVEGWGGKSRSTVPCRVTKSQPNQRADPAPKHSVC